MPLLARKIVLGLAIALLLLPVALILYQSALDGPFYRADARIDFSGFGIILADPNLYKALRTTLAICLGMVGIAVPLGAALAFVVVRTDLPGRRWIEPLILSPMFVSAIVLAFGYVVVFGPVGFVTLAWRNAFGAPPWYLYSLPSIVVLCGLNHVSHVYLYVATALRSLSSDVEEAGRVAGSSPLRVALEISLPMVRPAIVYVTILVFFMGFEQFGLPLVLGDPKGISVITTYLYALAQQFGLPKYEVLAAVAVIIIAICVPLVALQRHFLKASERYIAVRGKAAAQRLIPLGPFRWVAFGLIVAWLAVAAVLPVAGILLRSFLSAWGIGVDLWAALTLRNFETIFSFPSLQRGVVNTVLLATLGAAASVAVFSAVALAAHRWQSGWTRAFDYSVLAPRAMPGLIIGLAVFWIFLFVPLLSSLRQTIIAIWLAYSIVWIGYGLRLISSALLQISPDLDEAARVAGAGRTQASLYVTLPLLRPGMIAAWILLYIAFVREYATAVYLFAPGTEVLGSLMISLWNTGGLEHIAALSTINLILVAVGVVAALRMGKINA